MRTRHWRTVLAVVAAALLSAGLAAAQEVDDTVLMRSPNPAGVPVHPADGDMSFERWPNGSTGIVQEISTVRGWIRVRAADGDEGWIVRKYLTVLMEEEEDEGTETLAYVVGSWNIEHFKNGTSRGFPENTRGGPNYPQHERDLTQVAGIIRDSLQAAILVLNEINGRSGSNPAKSDEMDALVAELGSGWEYFLSFDGGSQRIALLHDTSKAQRGRCQSFSNSSGPRDHLGCLFTFLAPDGSTKNDLVVIGVHLKSGQSRTAVHNGEMADLAGGFAAAFDGDPFPSVERDVVVAGDFNANRYDSRQENFWNNFAGTAFDIDVLAPVDATDYSPTRLARVPLRPNSVIDYIMGSQLSGGVGDDLVLSTAHVHDELLSSPFENFRRIASDHIPVTIRVRLSEDDD